MAKHTIRRHNCLVPIGEMGINAQNVYENQSDVLESEEVNFLKEIDDIVYGKSDLPIKKKKSHKRKKNTEKAERLFKKYEASSVSNSELQNIANSQIKVSPLIETAKNLGYEFANTVKKVCTIKSIASRKMLYVYDEKKGYFKPFSKDEFGVLLFELFKQPEQQMLLKSHVVNETFHFLISCPDLQITLTDFNCAEEHLLNVKNGVLNVKKLELKQHSPKYMFDYCLDVDFYNEYPKPEKFLNVMKQCFTEKEDRTLCKECLAYTLSNNSSAKKIWFFVGAANTGKSMLLKLMTRIIGEEFVASIPLENLNDKFSLKSAVHRRVNIVAEVPNLNLKEVRTLKMISGGDKVCIEGKFESSFFANLNLKFLLAGNHLPRLDTMTCNDDGIKQRFIFLGFYNSLDESERINDYDKILYEEEGDYIFSMLMRILRDFYERDCKFTETKNSRTLAETFGITTNSIARFIKKKCRVSSNTSERIACEDLYEAYESFCEDEDIPAQRKKDLWAYLEALPSHNRKKKIRVPGKKNPVQAILGVELLE